MYSGVLRKPIVIRSPNKYLLARVAPGVELALATVGGDLDLAAHHASRRSRSRPASLESVTW
jgi:hypothetical protein